MENSRELYIEPTTLSEVLKSSPYGYRYTDLGSDFLVSSYNEAWWLGHDKSCVALIKFTTPQRSHIKIDVIGKSDDFDLDILWQSALKACASDLRIHHNNVLIMPLSQPQQISFTQ